MTERRTDPHRPHRRPQRLQQMHHLRHDLRHGWGSPGHPRRFILLGLYHSLHTAASQTRVPLWPASATTTLSLLELRRRCIQIRTSILHVPSRPTGPTSPRLVDPLPAVLIATLICLLTPLLALEVTADTPLALLTIPAISGLSSSLPRALRLRLELHLSVSFPIAPSVSRVLSLPGPLPRISPGALRATHV